jgi:glycine/D-amino acid oxidase-like deaminating enzyme
MAEPTLQPVVPVDVVIVGGGIAGLATAAALSGLGRTLAVIEARELPVLSRWQAALLRTLPRTPPWTLPRLMTAGSVRSRHVLSPFSTPRCLVGDRRSSALRLFAYDGLGCGGYGPD